MKENATHALGFLLVGDEKFPHYKKLIDGLCEASKVMTTYFCFVSFQPFGNQGNPKENDMCINVVIGVCLLVVALAILSYICVSILLSTRHDSESFFVLF